jgi:hypothetical protein
MFSVDVLGIDISKKPEFRMDGRLSCKLEAGS